MKHCGSLLRQHAFACLLALALLATAGCGKQPRLQPLAQDAVVLAFGDSLTYGTGADERDSYPAQLALLIGRTVARAGVPGEISGDGLKRLPEALDEHQPRLLILCHGGNDFLRRLSRQQVAANVRAMIRLAKERGVEVVLIGTPEPGLAVSAPEFYAEIARELRVPYEDGVIGQILRDSSLKSDPIHPNARGYRLIAERLAGLLKNAGAI
ncbi:MAG TPA: arylesterase [Burkholderiales bacterium]|jgi:lysophospholipase L1-like esterase|nr:arylesterase [Burkholderiales bacterium]